MKPLRLYRIEPEAFPAMHVAARSNKQAAEIYVAWEATAGRQAGSFSVELAFLEALNSQEKAQLQSLLAVSTEGIAFFESGRGWSIDSDGWISFDSGEEVR